jgi:hypothetical protein
MSPDANADSTFDDRMLVYSDTLDDDEPLDVELFAVELLLLLLLLLLVEVDDAENKVTVADVVALLDAEYTSYTMLRSVTA